MHTGWSKECVSVSMLAPVNICIHPRERCHGELQSLLFHSVRSEEKQSKDQEARASAQPEAMTDPSYSVGSVFRFELKDVKRSCPDPCFCWSRGVLSWGRRLTLSDVCLPGLDTMFLSRVPTLSQSVHWHLDLIHQ